MYNRNNMAFFLCFVMTLMFTGAVNANAASIKDRMVARIPAINILKDKGLVGENNKGLLEFRTASQPEKEMIQAENNDRQTVYAAIAKNEGVKAELVAQRRAKQIADKGSEGHWYQNSDGKWFKK